MVRRPRPDKPPVKKCPDCGKKMSAFKQDKGWKYICRDEKKHAADKLKAKQLLGSRNKGGVKRGTPSPMHGKEYPKPVRRKWRWGSEKDKDPHKK